MEESSKLMEALNTNVEELSFTVKKINSYRFIFLRGIINGVGTFVGATLVATIVITILIHFLGFFGFSGFFESFLPHNR